MTTPIITYPNQETNQLESVLKIFNASCLDEINLSLERTHLIKALSAVASEIPECAFAVLYGSTVLGDYTSDLDVKFFFKSEVEQTYREKLAAYVEEANRALDIKLTAADVPYLYKVAVSNRIVQHSLALTPFLHNSYAEIPKVDFSPTFLCSDQCQMRTVLGLLTTPHILIHGDLELWRCLRAAAGHSLTSLVLRAYGLSLADADNYHDCLVGTLDKRQPKEHLGYRPIFAHRKWIELTLAL